MGHSTPKQYLDLSGRSIAQHTLDLFLSLPQIGEIAIVCEEEYRPHFGLAKVQFAQPGALRHASVAAGVAALSEKVSWVLIHDIVRPFVSAEEVTALIAAMEEHGAATLAAPVRYSVKEIDSDGFVAGTLDRRRVWEVQTPQGMRRDWLVEGFYRAELEGWEVTDEATLIEGLGYPVKVVEGGARNLKITTPEDLLLARQLHASL